MSVGVTERLHEAMLTCAARDAFRFSMDDVAREAGVSRATIYRYFPGGKEQLISDGVAFEVGRFFNRVHAAVVEADDLAGQLELALTTGHRLLEEHEVLHRILREDPEQFLSNLEAVMIHVRDGIEAYLASLLARESLAEGVDVEEAAEYLARLYLSYLGHAGPWELAEPEEVAGLVRTQFIGGILGAG